MKVSTKQILISEFNNHYNYNKINNNKVVN